MNNSKRRNTTVLVIAIAVIALAYWYFIGFGIGEEQTQEAQQQETQEVNEMVATLDRIKGITIDPEKVNALRLEQFTDFREELPSFSTGRNNPFAP